ncbi:potassium channel family protein [Congregibacter sp.]|nr:ion channel [Congregibacter sp.]MDA8961956.1 potassium channel family protein [Congregibacter sp.]
MLKILLINGAVIALAVVIHYEFLYQFTMVMPRLRIRHRFRILLGVFAALTAHTLEVWIFATAYYLMDKTTTWGGLQGNYDGSLLGSVYFSFTAFTTLGLGDIEPTGNVRYLVGLESLTGFVLITWTASFLYLEMTRYWDKD